MRLIKFCILFIIAADVLLGEEPWLNATSACAFPLPSNSRSKPKETNVDVAFYKTPIEERTTESVPKHMVEQFLGDYGNFAYGNMTVVADDVTGYVIGV